MKFINQPFPPIFLSIALLATSAYCMNDDIGFVRSSLRQAPDPVEQAYAYDQAGKHTAALSCFMYAANNNDLRALHALIDYYYAQKDEHHYFLWSKKLADLAPRVRPVQEYAVAQYAEKRGNNDMAFVYYVRAAQVYPAPKPAGVMHSDEQRYQWWVVENEHDCQRKAIAWIKKSVKYASLTDQEQKQIDEHAAKVALTEFIC